MNCRKLFRIKCPFNKHFLYSFAQLGVLDVSQTTGLLLVGTLEAFGLLAQQHVVWSANSVRLQQRCLALATLDDTVEARVARAGTRRFTVRRAVAVPHVGLAIVTRLDAALCTRLRTVRTVQLHLHLLCACACACACVITFLSEFVYRN